MMKMDCDRARSKHSCHPTSPYLLPTAAKTAARGGIKLDHDGRIARLCHLGVERPKSIPVESSLMISLRARDTARCQTGWNGKGNHMLTPELTLGAAQLSTEPISERKCNDYRVGNHQGLNLFLYIYMHIYISNI